MNVLIIEDHEPMALLVAALTNRVAARVEIAHTMAKAWEWLLKKNGFDVVFLDLGLPDSTLATSMDSIRKIKGTGRKVVVITNHWDGDTFSTARECGADYCFYKGDPDFASRVKESLASPAHAK